VVKNVSPAKESVTITSLVDDKFGTLSGDDDCKVGTVLAAGAECDFTAVFAVTGQPATPHVNVFTAKAVDNEKNEANDTDDAVVGFTNLTKSVSSQSAEDGAVVTYTLVLENGGTASVKADLSDLLPTGASYVADTTQRDGSDFDNPAVVGQSLTWAGVEVAAKDSTTFTYDVMVAKDLPNGTSLINDATWAGNEGRVTVTVDNPGIPGLVKATTTPSPVGPGSTVDYTVTLTNTGGAPVESDLVDVLPAGTSFKEATGTTPDPSSVVGQVVTWDDVTVNPGATFVATYTVDVAAGLADGTTLTNDATWAKIQRDVTVYVRTGAIEVTKTDIAEQPKPLPGAVFQLWTAVKDGDALVPGEKIGQPSKPTGADGKASWDNLPWGSYFVQEVTAPDGYGLDENGIKLVVIDRDTFQCDDDRVALLQDEVPGDVSQECGGIEFLTFANPPIDIPSLDKTSDPSDGTAVETGDTIEYTITVKNDGALPLTEQTLVDTLPTGVTLDQASVTPAGDTSVAGKITWSFDLGAFSEVEFTYSVKVTAGFGSEPLVNSVTWVQKELTRTTTNPVKAISAVTTSFCVLDAPYYSVAVKSQNLTNVNDTVTIRWYQANDQGQPIDSEGNPTTDPTKYVAAFDPAIGTPAGNYVDTYQLTNGSLDIPEILWKGAEVDADGRATVWPGWIQPSPGVWEQVPSGGVRPGMFAVVTVNPTAQTVALYPPAAAPCANPPGVPTLDKTSDPADGEDVAIGDDIEYTVTVTNTGGSTFTGPMVDTLPSGFEVDEASVTASGGTLSGNKITWNVTLDVDEVKTFTYSGTVAPGAEGDLVNRVVLTLEDGTIEDSTTHPVSPVSPIEDEDDEEKVDGEELADTGANGVGNLVGAALLAMLAGGLMVTFGRRRREQ
jgi:uncharacterized repeat protein (TIGR01451 family)